MRILPLGLQCPDGGGDQLCHLAMTPRIEVAVQDETVALVHDRTSIGDRHLSNRLAVLGFSGQTGEFCPEQVTAIIGLQAKPVRSLFVDQVYHDDVRVVQATGDAGQCIQERLRVRAVFSSSSTGLNESIAGLPAWLARKRRYFPG